jgi:membrane-bound lytic murein transglycosylase A
MIQKGMRFIALFFCLFLIACDEGETPAPDAQNETQSVKPAQVEEPSGPIEQPAEPPPPPPPPKMILEEVGFDTLPDWGSDNFKTFIPAFQKSCEKINKISSDRAFGPLEQAGTYSDWQKMCKKFESTSQNVQTFFETHFTPYMVRADEDPIGLFTGYYEASLKGSRTRTDVYNTPLHKRPDDLVMVNLGEFREELKGQRIAGRVKGGNLKPYENREDIVNGDWPHNDEVLVWVDDAVDAFFVQIQGSGIVTLNDGSTMRIGYAGQNGHPYYAIGRELIKREHLTKENVSMQSIRAWLSDNPDHADEVMNTNRSYVFFREINGAGPIGAQGVALTAGRSLAVDRTKISYGIPIWVDIEKPVEDANDIRRMMIAQDTGGAIIGAVRGDVFWGYGAIAEDMAGKMKSKGRYWVLLPKRDEP